MGRRGAPTPAEAERNKESSRWKGSFKRKPNCTSVKGKVFGEHFAWNNLGAGRVQQPRAPMEGGCMRMLCERARERGGAGRGGAWQGGAGVGDTHTVRSDTLLNHPLPNNAARQHLRGGLPPEI